LPRLLLDGRLTGTSFAVVHITDSLYLLGRVASERHLGGVACAPCEDQRIGRLASDLERPVVKLVVVAAALCRVRDYAG